MKIAIPSMGNMGKDELVSPHFGSAPTFTIYDSETDEYTVLANTSQHMGGVGYPPELLHSNGVSILICMGVGMKALQMFNQFNVTVYNGAAEKVSSTIDLWKNNALSEASFESACAGHEHH